MEELFDPILSLGSVLNGEQVLAQFLEQLVHNTQQEVKGRNVKDFHHKLLQRSSDERHIHNVLEIFLVFVLAPSIEVLLVPLQEIANGVQLVLLISVGRPDVAKWATIGWFPVGLVAF